MEEPRGQPGGSEKSRDRKDRKLAGLQSRWERGGGSRAQGCCHQVQAGATCTCPIATGVREVVQLQRGRGRSTCASLPTPTLGTRQCFPSFSLGKANHRGHTPWIQNRVGKGQEKASGKTAKACPAVTLQSYSHSTLCVLSRTQYISILQPRVKVSCSKVSATDICSDCTNVTLSNNRLFH